MSRLEHKDEDFGGTRVETDKREEKKADMVAVAIIVVVAVSIVAVVIANVF